MVFSILLIFSGGTQLLERQANVQFAAYTISLNHTTAPDDAATTEAVWLVQVLLHIANLAMATARNRASHVIFVVVKLDLLAICLCEECCGFFMRF